MVDLLLEESLAAEDRALNREDGDFFGAVMIQGEVFLLHPAFVLGGGASDGHEREIAGESQKLYNRVKNLHELIAGKNVYSLLNRLKAVMSDKAGVFRQASALEQALNSIAELREEYKRVFIFGSCIRYCQELVTLIEFDHMLDVAEVIVKGALLREETRGSHFRTDHAKRNDETWLKHTIMTYTDKGPEVSYRTLNVDKYKPQERKY